MCMWLLCCYSEHPILLCCCSSTGLWLLIHFPIASDLCFAGNVDSFPFRQISGALYVHFLAKVMPKFSMNFGMTCARKLDILSARDLSRRE